MSDPLPDDAARLWRLVEVWLLAVDDLTTLVGSLDPEDALAPTDLAGWNVADNVAHVAHLEAVLAGTPEETLEVPDAPHLLRPMQRYTEAGVLARRGRLLTELLEELGAAVTTRYGRLRADPPTDPTAAPPLTPGGVAWDTGTLLRNRPFDVWLHEQDVRRALGRPGGYDGAPARHALAVLLAALPVVVGKRVAPPIGTACRLELPEAGTGATAVVGANGRAHLLEEATPDVTVRLSSEDFVVLAAGRRGRDAVDPVVEGDTGLAEQLLASLAVTP